MDLFSFERLDSYRESRKLAVDVYRIIRELPSIERFDLGSQMRRSMISVTSNIAEGCGRISIKEKIHFIEIAYGSLLEVYSQIQLSVDLGYTRQEDLELLQLQFTLVARLLNGLRKSYINKSDNPASKNINPHNSPQTPPLLFP